MSYEKFREANDLAAISRALREQQAAVPSKQADNPPPKQTHQPVEKARGNEAAHIEMHQSSDREPSPGNEPVEERPTTKNTETPPKDFNQWYIETVADGFSAELESLQESGHPAPSSVVFRSLMSLGDGYTETEKQLATL